MAIHLQYFVDFVNDNKFLIESLIYFLSGLQKNWSTFNYISFHFSSFITLIYITLRDDHKKDKLIILQEQHSNLDKIFKAEYQESSAE